MTAEVTLLNCEAVALAADSAVTIRSPDAQKIFQSANKIFSLKGRHSVGVMIYSNASCMGFPWETIVKMYRDQLPVTPYATLKEYASSLFEYLSAYSRFLERNAEDDFVRDLVGGYFELIVHEVRSEVHDRIANGPLGSNDIKGILAEKVREFAKQAADGQDVPGLQPETKAALARDYAKLIADLIGDVFEKLPLDARLRRRLIGMGHNLLTKFPNGTRADFSTGVVIAGFGADEVFPSVKAFQVEGFLRGGYVRYREDPRTRDNLGDDRRPDAVIYPFAQQEMVFTFMEGVNPDYEALIETMLHEVVVQLPARLIGALPRLSAKRRAKLESDLRKAGHESLTEIFRDLRAFRQQEFSRPVMRMVSNLPKDELAAMAEALVNLTSFKRRVTPEAETVGGPIDVAVISKGDGFVWIKRKHYFDARMNPHFMAKYANKGGAND